MHSVFTRPVLVMGLDVTHDTTGRSISIGALVGSVDCPPLNYVAEEITMAPKQEIVERSKVRPHALASSFANINILRNVAQMIEAVKNRIMAFFKSTRGVKPKHIIYYRDGVSDSQFSEVRC